MNSVVVPTVPVWIEVFVLVGKIFSLLIHTWNSRKFIWVASPLNLLNTIILKLLFHKG